MRKKKLSNLKEAGIRAFFFTCGVLAVLVLVGIFLTLVMTAVPAFREIKLSEFLLSKAWDPTSPEKAEYGILSMVVSTLMVTGGALLLAVPIGIGAEDIAVATAIYHRARELGLGKQFCFMP